jgi:ribonuclease I
MRACSGDSKHEYFELAYHLSARLVYSSAVFADGVDDVKMALISGPVKRANSHLKHKSK